MLTRIKCGFDFVYGKRFQFGREPDPAPYIATEDHPRLRQSSRDFDSAAEFVLASDEVFEWNALSDDDAHAPLRDFAARSRELGLHDGFMFAVRYSRNTCYVWELCKSSPSGTVLSDAEKAEIIGRIYLLSAQVDPVGPRRTEGSPLTSREIEVLRWCMQGKNYSAIGTILGISNKTVEFHMTNAMRKLGVNDKLAAILTAIRCGYIPI